MHIIMHGRWNLHEQWFDCIVYAKSRHKGQNHSSRLPFPSMASHLSLHNLFFQTPLSPPFSFHFLSIHCLCSPHHTCPSSPFLPFLPSPLRVEDLLADPDPTHKRRVDNQLPLSSSLNWSSSEFPRDAMPSETGVLPIIPHLPSHSSLWLPYPLLLRFLCFRMNPPAAAGWTAFSLREGYDFELSDWQPSTHLVQLFLKVLYL